MSEARTARHTTLERLEPVLALTDPIGVLSVYVDADPALAAGPRPAWQAPVRAGLRRLVKEARETWPRDDRFALEARLDELDGELERLLDPRGSSRGRALFATIAGGETRRLELRSQLPAEVRLGRRAVVLPLLAALQEGRAAGVASVERARLGLSEWEDGTVRLLETIELEGEPERGEPPATNPAVPQSFPERDRFETGVGARVASQVRDAGAVLAREAEARSWDVVVADGDPRLLDALELGSATGTAELVRSPQPFAGQSAAEVADRVEPTLREHRADATARLVGRLEGSAATQDPGVVDRALAEGRVEHLLLAPAADPDHAEELARRALETGAEVTIVDGPPVAALLRW